MGAPATAQGKLPAKAIINPARSRGLKRPHPRHRADGNHRSANRRVRAKMQGIHQQRHGERRTAIAGQPKQHSHDQTKDQCHGDSCGRDFCRSSDGKQMQTFNRITARRPRADECGELVRVHRLFEECHCAIDARSLAALRIAGGAHQNHRQFRPAEADELEQIETIHHRHFDIADDRFNRLRRELVDGFLAIESDEDFVSQAAHQTFDPARRKWIVVHDENQFRFCIHIRRYASMTANPFAVCETLHSALSPSAPERMFTARSTGRMKMRPSPLSPV